MSAAARREVPLVPPLPREIQLEVTGSCNLRCRMCLVRYRPVLNRREGSMPFATFRAVVDELPQLEAVTLQGLGEPLLAPDLFEMIDYAVARGIRIGFNTNATLLTRERGERLIRAGLHWVHVSIDGATAPTYEGIRDGAAFDRVADNVSGFMETRARLGGQNPEVSLVFVAMRRNLGELERLVRMAGRWGIERVHVQNLSHSFDDARTDPAFAEIRRFTAEEALWAEPTEEMEAALRDARQAAAEAGVTLRLPRLHDRPPRRRLGTPGCTWPFDMAYVTHQGKVQPCCMVMGEDRAVLGDAAESGFAAVWEGEAYRGFRQALLGDEPPEVCRGCSLYRGVF